MLALQLLGPVVLRRDGAALPLTIRKTSALLVLLALGGPTPRARVAALLWPDLEEAIGRRNLRRELARLREVGAHDAVLADGDRLALAPTLPVDAGAFQRTLQAGDSTAALAQWRGPPADGLDLDDAPPFMDWLAQQRDRLQALRRQALQGAAAAAETRGETEAALALLQQLLADDPLQEQHHRAVMRLLGASGRREAALQQYRRCCDLLRDELGLAPMAETEALVATLRGEEAPRGDASPARPPALLPAVLPFVGRTAELGLLETGWTSGHAVVIVGEAGIGKSRLALDFVAAHGPYALARCRPGDADLPFAAFTRALRALGGPSPLPDGLAGWAIDELARLLPELGPPPPPIRTDDERNRFFEACVQAWRLLAGDSFDAVVLDDWHLADAASQRLLGGVARRRRDDGRAGPREWLLLRPEPGPEPVAMLVEALQAQALTLQPLDDPAVFELVRQLSGARSPERFAARLQRATAGNPFFMAETLRHLAEQHWLAADADGVWRTPVDEATQDYRELPVPASVREAVLARIRRLGAAVVRVLEAAALADEPFVPALLAPACALSELDTVLAIERALEAQLLHEHEAGGFAFAHDLVQQALQAALAPQRRRLVHRRLALAAEAAGAPAALVAGHHEAAGDAARAVPFRLAAGDQAQRLNQQPEAIAHWRRGLADGPLPAQALALRLRLLVALRQRDEGEAAREQAQALHTLAQSGSLAADERCEALIAVARDGARTEGAAAALALLDALDPPPDAHLQALSLRARADLLRDLGRNDEAVAAARAALALPALAPRDRADVLHSLVIVEHRAGRTLAALELVDTLLAASTPSSDASDVAVGLIRRGVFLLEMGRTADAEQALEQAVAHGARAGLVQTQRNALYNLCVLQAAQGRPDRVLVSARQSWALQPAPERSERRLMLQMAFVDAHVALGELGAAWEHAQAAVHDALALGGQFGIAALAMTGLELLGWLGEQALARRLLGGLDDAATRQIPQVATEMWLARVSFELLGGDVAAARDALQQAGPAAAIEHERVRLRHALAAAELALAEAGASQVVALLPPDDAPAMNDEMRCRSLALRLAAAPTPALRTAARAALARPATHALAALALARALRPDPAATGLAGRLAGSLQAHPVQQTAFLRMAGAG